MGRPFQGCRFDRQHEGLVGAWCERPEACFLIALEVVEGPLAGRGMHAHVGDRTEPLLGLLVQVRVADEGAAVDEAGADVADRSFDLSLDRKSVV